MLCGFVNKLTLFLAEKLGMGISAQCLQTSYLQNSKRFKHLRTKTDHQTNKGFLLFLSKHLEKLHDLMIFCLQNVERIVVDSINNRNEHG
jgi:hypothetical protein